MIDNNLTDSDQEEEEAMRRLFKRSMCLGAFIGTLLFLSTEAVDNKGPGLPSTLKDVPNEIDWARPVAQKGPSSFDEANNGPETVDVKIAQIGKEQSHGSIPPPESSEASSTNTVRESPSFGKCKTSNLDWELDGIRQRKDVCHGLDGGRSSTENMGTVIELRDSADVNENSDTAAKEHFIPTQFERWIVKEGEPLPDGSSETSLLQQLALANQLYTEAEGPSKKQVTVEEVIEQLQTSSFLEENLVKWNGISVDWFLDVFLNTKYMQQLIQFGCELWFVRKVCIIELLSRHGQVHSGALIDHVGLWPATNEVVAEKPTVFLSYTGKYKLNHFIELLEQLRGEFIWMDIFCVDQFAWTGKSRTIEMQSFRDRLVYDLQGNIEQIDNTILLLEHWNDTITTLKQIWVLWEVFNTVESKAKFSIVLAPIQKQRFLQAIDTGSDDLKNVMTNLSKIDCDKALAENDEDRAAILRRMKDVGLYNVSKKATEMVRDWLCTVITNHAASLLASRDEPSADMVSISGSINNMALLLHDQGKLEEALPLYEEALAGYRQVLGDRHPDTLTTINNMAELLRNQGKLEEALPLFEEALAAQRQVLGDRHPQTLGSINNMANLLKDQGKLEEALPLYEEALAGYRQVLGDRHQHTLDSINNMAALLGDQGKMEEALPLFEEALAARRQILGDKHPDTLSSINNMAALLQNQGKYDEALPLYEEALSARKQVLGDRHPDTLGSINNMALLLRKQGKLEEALPLHEEALAARRQVLGDRHPSTLGSINNMAVLLEDQGKLEEALPLKKEALVGYRQVLGDRHPDTLSSINNMAVSLKQQGKLEEALPLYKEALSGFLQVLGPEHPHCALVQENIRNCEELLQGE